MNVNRIAWTFAALFAVALSVGATCCFAETLNANVPFKFQVQDQQFPPGDYTITHLENGGGNPVLLLRNWEAHKSTLLVPIGRSAKSGNDTPRIVFHCGEEGCALSEIWGAGGAGGLTVPQPRNAGRSERTSLVYLTRHKSGH